MLSHLTQCIGHQTIILHLAHTCGSQYTGLGSAMGFCCCLTQLLVCLRSAAAGVVSRWLLGVDWFPPVSFTQLAGTWLPRKVPYLSSTWHLIPNKTGAGLADEMTATEENSVCSVNAVQRAWGHQGKEKPTLFPRSLTSRRTRQVEKRGCLCGQTWSHTP